MMCKTLLSILLLSCTLLGSAQEKDTLTTDSSEQDRILLMNGRELKGKVLEVGMGELVYEHFENGDTVHSKIPVAEVFSIDKPGEDERVLYEQDSTIGNSLDRRQMRYFIRGERDAMEGYRSPWTTAIGVGVGAAGGYFLELSIFTVTVPLVYTLGASVPKTRIDKGTVSDPAYLDHEFYLKGYEREARGERLLNALKGSAAGVLLGAALYVIVHPDQLR